MTQDDLEYYELRAKQESDAAATCSSIEAASAHRALASEYEAHARELRSGRTRPQPGVRAGLRYG